MFGTIIISVTSKRKYYEPNPQPYESSCYGVRRCPYHEPRTGDGKRASAAERFPIADTRKREALEPADECPHK